MIDKFRYSVLPDKTYVLKFDNFQVEVKGQEILDRLYREYHVEHLWDDLDWTKPRIVFDGRNQASKGTSTNG